MNTVVQGTQPARVVNKVSTGKLYMDVDMTSFIARWVRMAMFHKKLLMTWHQCVLKIHGGKSNKVCFVQEHPKISSKAIYAGEWLWRQRYGEDPFGNIIKHIADYMKYAEMRKFCLVPLYALFVI